MKKLLLFSAFALIILVSNARAHVSLATGADTTFQAADAQPECEKFSTKAECVQNYYEALKAMFDTGTVPDVATLKGWYSGRCFSDAAATRAKNVILVGWEDFVGGNNGPLFPGKYVYKGVYIWKPSESADYFDTITEAKESEVNEIWNRYKKEAMESKVEGGSLVTGIPGQVIWNMRQSGEYVTMQIFQENRANHYCYLAKKVK